MHENECIAFFVDLVTFDVGQQHRESLDQSKRAAQSRGTRGERDQEVHLSGRRHAIRQMQTQSRVAGHLDREIPESEVLLDRQEVERT